jgi:hypothetical protein
LNVPNVTSPSVYVLDAGHFALDKKADEIAALTRAFPARGGETLT